MISWIITCGTCQLEILLNDVMWWFNIRLDADASSTVRVCPVPCEQSGCFVTVQEAMTQCMQSREHQYIFEPVCASVLLRRNASKEPLRSRNTPRIEGQVQLEPMSLRLSQVCMNTSSPSLPTMAVFQVHLYAVYEIQNDQLRVSGRACKTGLCYMIILTCILTYVHWTGYWSL